MNRKEIDLIGTSTEDTDEPGCVRALGAVVARHAEIAVALAASCCAKRRLIEQNRSLICGRAI